MPPSFADIRADPATCADGSYGVPRLDFTWRVDFADKTIEGHAVLTIARDNVAAATPLPPLLLDVHHSLVVHRVELRSSPLSFEVRPFASFGSCLVVTLPEDTLFPAELAIAYTAGGGPALSWLEPSQTHGGAEPYLYTQGQACLNRSLFPCIDSPANRQTWKATVIAPSRFTAVMSGLMGNRIEGDIAVGESPLAALRLLRGDAGPAGQAIEEGLSAFHFSMAISVPSYLIALAVGDLRTAVIGPRSRAWAEPGQLAAASHEFSLGNLTEKYLAAGEAIAGPYVWGEYNVLAMPPSFPFGGMENTTLTFVTPCLLTGDQSLMDVVAHEIAHSWTGNLVTNASWEEFFLNEGPTMCLQRLICERVHGKAFTACETATGRSLLVRLMRESDPLSPLTRLRVPVAGGVDPEETYNETPYEKGFAFMSYLRAVVADDAAFAAWLRSYFASLAYRSVRSVDLFESFFLSFPALRGEFDAGTWAAVDAAAAPAFWGSPSPVPAAFDTEDDSLHAAGNIVGSAGMERGLAFRTGLEFSRWLHAPGWPAFYPNLSAGKALIQEAESLLAHWFQGATSADTASAVVPATPAAFASWPVYQKLHFLDGLVDFLDGMAPPPPATAHLLLRRLDATYGFSVSSNAEVRQRWSQAVGAACYEPSYPSVADFLRSQGKQKYTLSVYRSLMGRKGGESGDAGAARRAAQAFSREIFAATQAQLHVTLRGFVAAVLQADAAV